jgi:sec-independent protein translocase protein TatA
MFGNLGFMEIMALMVVVLLVFGAKRLPEIGSSMGKGIREFKRSLTDTQEALTNATSDDRTVPPRSADGQSVAPPSSSEPKRLSQ